ncbi:hypothetical protein [uncultured Ferrovibrio sp.]|jgi:hypothetical protein|uniref:hypothetical protein n=1 Tax=uncultured Ferrovibrio sp. TaxID=1576913 RepID=UPI0026165B1D|nr:hypothetical protein [uncultured Ferrovibrio sp.]
MHDAWKCWTCQGSGQVDHGNGTPRICAACKGHGVSLSGTAAVFVMSGLVGGLLFFTDLNTPGLNTLGLFAQIERIEAVLDATKRPESAVLILHWNEEATASGLQAELEPRMLQIGTGVKAEIQAAVGKP